MSAHDHPARRRRAPGPRVGWIVPPEKFQITSSPVIVSGTREQKQETKKAGRFSFGDKATKTLPTSCCGYEATRITEVVLQGRSSRKRVKPSTTSGSAATARAELDSCKTKRPPQPRPAVDRNRCV